MTTDESQAEDGEDGFKPLTAQEASDWRKTQRNVSVWQVLVLQAVASVLAGSTAFILSGVQSVAWSVAYGGMAVLIPSMVMAYGITSSRLSRLLAVFPAGSLGGLVFWEGVKVLLVVAMLVSAPLLVRNLSWLGMLAGLVVVLKVYWVAYLMLSRVKK